MQIESIQKELGKKIRETRKLKGYTQEELAERSDISYKNIQYLESKNPTCPSLRTLNKLAKAFNLSLSELFKFK